MPACLGWAMAALQKMGQEEICAPVESGVAKTGLSGAKREGRNKRRERSEDIRRGLMHRIWCSLGIRRFTSMTGNCLHAAELPLMIKRSRNIVNSLHIAENLNGTGSPESIWKTCLVGVNLDQILIRNLVN